jgi:serine/threonine protein kinase
LSAKIGSGGWASVYLCTHSALQTPMAVKVMSLPPGTSLARQHFEREIKTVRSLRHDSVVAIRDTGTFSSNGVQFGWLAMEYLAGGQIDEYVRKRNAGHSDILQFFRTIVETMLAAHQAGILHRDIKPSNVIMSEDGKPHITDFGLAGFLDSERSPDNFDSVWCPGTPAYMAPELLDGTSRATVQTEIFSLGVLLFSLVSGDHPLGNDAKSRLQLVHRLRDQALPRLLMVRPDVSADLDCFVARCWKRIRLTVTRASAAYWMKWGACWMVARLLLDMLQRRNAFGDGLSETPGGPGFGPAWPCWD